MNKKREHPVYLVLQLAFPSILTFGKPIYASEYRSTSVSHCQGSYHMNMPHYMWASPSHVRSDCFPFFSIMRWQQTSLRMGHLVSMCWSFSLGNIPQSRRRSRGMPTVRFLGNPSILLSKEALSIYTPTSSFNNTWYCQPF